MTIGEFDDKWRKDMKALTKDKVIELYRYHCIAHLKALSILQEELDEWKSKLSDYSKKPRIKNL